MSGPVQSLLASFAALPVEDQRFFLAEVARIAPELADDEHPPTPEPTGEAYLAELKRRSDEIDAGTAVLTPWPEVRRRVNERLGRRDG